MSEFKSLFLLKNIDLKTWLLVELCLIFDQILSSKREKLKDFFRKGGNTSPQSLILTFSYLLAYQPWGLLLNFDWLVHLVDCPNVTTTICNLQKKNFVYHHRGCTMYIKLSTIVLSLKIPEILRETLQGRNIKRGKIKTGVRNGFKKGNVRTKS